ncbi:hypothetical protein Tco_1088854, partial [Tanacetum coccineum]
MIYCAISLDDMSTISSAGVSGIGNNPTFDVVDTSQPVCSICKRCGCFPSAFVGDPMPNVGTPGLFVDAVGAHTMAPPKDRIPDTRVSGLQLPGTHTQVTDAAPMLQT